MKPNAQLRNMLREELSRNLPEGGSAKPLEKLDISLPKDLLVSQPILFDKILHELTVFTRLLLQEAYTRPAVQKVYYGSQQEQSQKSPLFRTIESFFSEIATDHQLREEFSKYFDRINLLGLDEFGEFSRNDKKRGDWLADFTQHDYFHRYVATPDTLYQSMNRLAERCYSNFLSLQGPEQLVTQLAASRPSLIDKDVAALATAELPLITREIIKYHFSNHFFGDPSNENDRPLARGVSALCCNTLLNIFSDRLVSCLHRETELNRFTDRILKAHARHKFIIDRLSGKDYVPSGTLGELKIGLASLVQQRKFLYRSLEQLKVLDLVAAHHQRLIELLPEEPLQDKKLLDIGDLKFPPPELVRVLFLDPNDQRIFYALQIDAAKERQLLSLNEMEYSTDPKIASTHEFIRIAALPQREYLLLDLATYAPFSDDTISRNYAQEFKRTPISQTISTLHQKLLTDLRIAQEMLPEVFSRYREIPRHLTVHVVGDVIELRFPRTELPHMRHFFSYDEEIIASFDRQVQVNPHLRTIIACFTRKNDKNKEAESSTSETSADTVLARREVSQLLYSKVSNFAELFNILKKHFDVTLSNHGNGAHKGLNRGGYYFALSTNFRSETDPLHHNIAVRLLEALHIPLEDFARLLRD